MRQVQKAKTPRFLKFDLPSFVHFLSPSSCVSSHSPSLVQSLQLQQGIENSLVAKADSACDLWDQGKITAALNKLEAFINEVEAQRGKKVANEDADVLIGAVLMIIDGG